MHSQKNRDFLQFQEQGKTVATREKTYIGKWIWTVALFLFFFSLGQTCYGVTADEILVVANDHMAESEEIAQYYMKQRHIPKNHLLLVSLTTLETINRDEYETELKKPVREKIKALQPERITAIVLIYGIPLKVRPPKLDEDTAEKLADLKKDLKLLRQEVKAGSKPRPEIHVLQKTINDLVGTNKRASVDSELALVKAGDYPLSGWIKNPYFVGFQKQNLSITKNDVLLVSRLDGPDPKVVYRIIDDSIAAEKTGLHGTGYFDARWPEPQNYDKKLSGYKLYDASLYRAAKLVEKRMPVKVEKTGKVFPPGSAPDAALYAGWYSLGHYIDSFTWVKGAVGYHIASNECSTLRHANSMDWCIQMLEHGVAATLGPVYEPYVQGFPLPEVFFATLTNGDFNLGESYLLSLPFLSWQMVLVGDPLYKPF